MDFSSLVLMEKDKETGFITKELGSFSVNDGALFVKRFYVDDNKVFLKFDTNKDVEEWEFSAIYDLFDVDSFKNKGFEIEEDLEEFNPTFIITFPYDEEYSVMNEKVSEVIELINDAMVKVFEDIRDKEREYTEE
ncbi:MAG: DUF6762 family protein [Clostridium sp.]|uniref:DUF6762 family protein n=1 Tax=Clostridium sp. TaxID=1506 RepID=UPI003EE4267D